MHEYNNQKEDGQKIKNQNWGDSMTFSTSANTFLIVVKETTQPLQLRGNFADQH